jgi:4-hydroxy-tetrahydrodipicolinate synthase
MAHDLQTLKSRYYTASVVPFDKSGKLDEGALRDEIRYFCEERFLGVGGYIVNAEAGEIYYLSREEKRRAIEITLEEVNGRMPVVTGVFELTTAGCVESAREAKSLGVDGLFLMPPAGCIDLVTAWKSDQYPEYWLDQIKAIDEVANLPIIAHPVGAPTPQWGIGVAGETAKLICEQVPNVIAWKGIYSYEGLRKIWKILRGLDRQVSIMAAGGRFFHEYLAYDVLDGTVSGSWNYGLEPMLDHIDAWKAGDHKKALEIWNEGGLGDLHDYIYADYSRLHLRYKIAAWVRGLIPSPIARPPMPRPKPAEVETIYRLMQGANVPVIARSKLNFD